MKVENSTCKINNLSFAAGLTNKIRTDISRINVLKTEQDFADLNVICNFKNNKSIAAMSVYASNLLLEAAEKFRLPFQILPPNIRAFDLSELIEPVEENCTGFCLTESDNIIKKLPAFETASVFYRNNPDNIDFYDNIAENSHKFGFSASGHFLSKILHELFHSIHINLIYNEFGYEGNCPLTKEIFNKGIKHPCGLKKVHEMNTAFNKENTELIKKSVGNYAAQSKMELFSEVLTKITTDCIDDEMSLTSNPIEKLGNYPEPINMFIKNELKL